MFFTQEDYKKIEKWLLTNSIKDTEFAGAATPLQGNETLAFVQNGKNVKVLLKDLIDQIFLLGVSDFLNISYKYNENYISLTQAIQLIPFKSRKVGQVITFLDEEGKWKLYQFQGYNVNQWNTTSLWVDLIQEFAGANVVADEEDLTGIIQNDKTVLKFKDKTYNTDDFSGLGRVYLRKNITVVTDPSTGKEIRTNLLTQKMLSKDNIIYIIQYDYNLNGQTITVPEGCVLKFEGGSISNGTIKFINTYINSNYKSFKSVIFEGQIFNSEVNPVIFGADNTGIIDSSVVINNLLAITDTIKFRKGVYLLSNITVNSNKTITGVGSSTIIKPTKDAEVIFNTSTNATGILFKNFRIMGSDTQNTMCVGIYFNSSKFFNCDSTITNISIDSLRGTGIVIYYGCSNMIISNCNIRNTINKIANEDYNTKYGYGILAHCSDSLFSNLNIGQSFNAGLKVNGGNQIVNCKCWGNGRYGVKDRGCGIYLTNGYNIVSNCSVEENSDCGIVIGGCNNKVNIACAGNGSNQGKPWSEPHDSYDILMCPSFDSPYRCFGNEVYALIREPALGDFVDYYLGYTDTSGIAIHDNNIYITTYNNETYTTNRLSDIVKYYFHDNINFNNASLKEIYTKNVNRFFPFVDIKDVTCGLASENTMSFTVEPNSNLQRNIFNINWLIPKTNNIDTICKVGYFYAEIENPEVLVNTEEVAIIIQFSNTYVGKGVMQQNPINGKYFIRALYYSPNTAHTTNPYFYFRIKYKEALTTDVTIKLSNMKIGLITEGQYTLNTLLADSNYHPNMWYYYYYTQGGLTYSLAKGATIVRKSADIGDILYIWDGNNWTNEDGTLTSKVVII